MKSHEIRTSFLSFFEEHEHLRIPSSPLVPEADPSLLFTNAGMVQFKNTFLGLEAPPAPRAASCQRCLRAGGKHNDLENVGRTTRHHTFFEMLGNFSFGDYFKEEAIHYSWEYLTRVLELPAERLWVTVHEQDEEAETIWREQITFPKARLRRCGEDNFWAMAEVGPCGPCTEIYYDHGETVPGAPPGAGHEGERYVELWNIVFTQYDRNAAGETLPIARPAVDTGMGLERLAAVLQGVHDNYETDVLAALLVATRALAPAPQADPVAIRVIADHLRAAAFLVSDGVRPGNEGRAYVLRRIIRRSLRFGSKVGLHEPFLHRLVEPLRALMGEAYPEFAARVAEIREVLRAEEERFLLTLEQGLRRLQKILDETRNGIVPGIQMFRLYDTYGFPPDLTTDAATERGLRVDHEGFEQAMREQQQRARQARRFEAKTGKAGTSAPASKFVGYETLRCTAKITALYQDDKAVAVLQDGAAGSVFLDPTPFYAEGGGQVGDQGLLLNEDGLRFEITDTQQQGNTRLHLGQLRQGELRIGQRVTAEVNAEARQAVARNHSATHLLHAALRTLLGKHISQQGSLVAPDRLRFDFSHNTPLSTEQLHELEQRVNDRIVKNNATQIRLMPYEEALKAGALTLGGEKYGAEVRMLNIGDGASLELCGGTHVQRTGDIGLFKITGQSAVAAGIRRLEAVTGTAALRQVQAGESHLAKLAQRLGATPQALEQRLDKLLTRTRLLEKQLEQARARLASDLGQHLADTARTVAGIQLVTATLAEDETELLKPTMDCLKERLPQGIIALATTERNKIRLMTGVNGQGLKHIHAGHLARFIADRLGGRGGGRPDLGQGGGSGDKEALREALDSVPAWIEEHAP